MAEGGVEVVAPQKAGDAASEPDAFRIAGGAGQGPGRLGYFIDLLLAFLDDVGGRLLCLRWLAVAALSKRRRSGKGEHCRDQHNQKLTQLQRKRHIPAGVRWSLPARMRVSLIPD